MIGAGGITGGGPDAAIFLVDHVVDREVFVRAETPLAPDPLVKHLGERFGEPVGDRLGQDRVVIVLIGLERGDQFVASIACGDGERADRVKASRTDRRDIIGQAAEVVLTLPFPLLSEKMESASLRLLPCRLFADDHVVAVGVRREEAINAARREQFFDER